MLYKERIVICRFTVSTNEMETQTTLLRKKQVQQVSSITIDFTFLQCHSFDRFFTCNDVIGFMCDIIGIYVQAKVCLSKCKEEKLRLVSRE